LTRPTAIGAAKNSTDPPRFRITHSCPQCGAPVDLDEGDRLLACPYCRVRLILALDGPPRYLLPAKHALDEEILYIPYWRVRGTLFSCPRRDADAGGAHRLLDRTILAVDRPGLPPSLGIRPQAMKLRAATAETPGKFCTPAVPWERVLPGSGDGIEVDDGVDRGLAGAGIEPGDRLCPPDAFIGETVSLIYQPVVLDDGVYDGVLGSRIAPVEVAEALRASPIESKERFGIRFLATLCPECGWELTGERDSLALLCRICSCVWEVKGRSLRSASYRVVRSSFRAEEYLPFWRIKADVNGVALRSYADLVRFANLPKLVQSDWENRELRFWVPAFKIQPEAFLRLARSTTIFQPERLADRFPPGEPDSSTSGDPALAGSDARVESATPDVHPTTLPASEAIESLKVLFAEIGTRREILLPLIRELEIAATETALAYLPFRMEGQEITNPEIPLAVNRNLLSYGRGL
jgi:DNA-directed RNA polymerase subunit RPC12/RpoP